ncbi:MAG: choice-of-anchor J domain-containing protein [Muribaculaceae bacterium]|nr:choice-of-anchor J domain-containing protein [Muribaculaceae bacterium]
MNQISKIKSIMMGAFAAVSFSVAAEDAPKILSVQPLYGGSLSMMSANGQWAVGDAPNPANSSFPAFPRLVNTETGVALELFTENEGLQSAAIGATCVSNDGKTVGGSYSGYPAVWKEGIGWTSLPRPKGKYNGGTVSAMTPDGKYAVGRVSIDLFNEYPCMWDLESMQLVELPGMIDSNPMYKDRIEEGGDPAEWSDNDLNVRLTGISPDANTLLGTVDFAFPEASWEFMYRRDEAKWFPMGLKYENGRLKALNDEILGVGDCVLSSDGTHIGGLCMTASDASVPFTCSVTDPENFSLHGDGEGYGVWAIGSDGVIYGSTPTSTPVRNWAAKVGNYWYDWKAVLNQVYGIDWMNDVTKDDLGLSGTVVSVSADNLKILAGDYAQGFAYVVSLPRPMAEICQDVDLLGDYRVSPMDGAEFSMLQKIVLDMGRPIEVTGEKNCVQLLDAEGNVVRSSINFAVQPDNNKRVEVIFRNYTLEPGKSYSVKIPAGSMCIAGDPERVNKEISIRYRGREAGPVKPVTFAPDNGASVARINFTTNPVMVTFNAPLSVGENPDIRLVQIKDGVEEFLYSLSASVSNNQVMIYPVTEQRLAEGTDYRIDFGAGSVADLSGDGANEAFSITYHGSYVPEIDPTSNTIFREDFSTGVAGMMLYEGDHNAPSDEMALLGFDADNMPWMPVLDDADEVGNYAAASHSSYDPAGKSDDWMVTPQLFIPDDKATLSFKSQSYRNIKNDVLKVYVWDNEDVVTILTKNMVDKIRYNGELVYNQKQNPGSKEETLADDWTLNTVDLSKYAGKYVYIAFVNDNQNQSVVFVDDIVVSRDVAAVMSIDTPQTVVDEDEVKIKGRLVVMKEYGIDGYQLTLSDADGNLIETISSDEALEKGEMCSFSFEKPVALEKGAVNSFLICFSTGAEKIEMKYDISDLLFETTKRVVLEEMTGTTCQFCPQGIITIEYLQDLFGDLFIPVAIHSYTGDKFGGSEHMEYTSFLGLNAAPTGRVARGEIVSPMYFDKADYIFTAPDGLTWLQKVEEELGKMATLDIDVKAANIDSDQNKVSLDVSVLSAINRSNANINVFGILMEDGLIGFQTNGLYTTEAPGLGEWGKDGVYGKSTVVWNYDDVVRGTSAIETAGIYSGFNGKGGYIPSEIKAGEAMDFSFDFTLPSGIADLNNTKVCLMLIDANTGEYINAVVTDHIPAAVDAIGADEAAVADVYDLTGRIVMRSASLSDISGLEPGIYIRAGKKFIKR